MGPDDELDEDSPIFAIAAAAELAGMHPQTLRQYDRMGLVVPGRTQGGSRRYSMRHVETAPRGGPDVGRRHEPSRDRAHPRTRRPRARTPCPRAATSRRACASSVESRPGARVFAAGSTGAVVTLRHGTRVRRATEVVLWRPRHPLAPGRDAQVNDESGPDGGDPAAS